MQYGGNFPIQNSQREILDMIPIPKFTTDSEFKTLDGTATFPRIRIANLFCISNLFRISNCEFVLTAG